MSTLDRAAESPPAALRPAPSTLGPRRPPTGRAPVLSRSASSRLFTEQVRASRVPSDLRLSPDGQRLAFTVARLSDADVGGATSAWTASGQDPPRLIAGDDEESAAVPRWSPDDTRLAMAVQRAESPLEAQIVVSADPFAVMTPVGTITGHVEDMMWAVDGTSLLVLCAEPGADSVVTSGAVRYAAPGRRHRPTVTRPGSGRRRLYDLNLATSRVRPLGPRTGSVWDGGLCADGTIAVVWSADSSESGWYDSRLGVLDRQSGDVREVYRSAWQLSPIAVADSGRRIAVVEGWSSDRGRVCGDIRIVDLDTGDVDAVPSFGVDVVSVSWRSPGSLWFAGWRGMAAVWGWVELDGTVLAFREDDIRPDRLCFAPRHAGSATDVWAVTQPSDGSAPEVVVGVLDDSTATWSTVTRLSRRQIDQFHGAETRPVSWTTPDATRIDGLLAMRAPNTGPPAPLVVYVHGGPASLWSRHLTPEVRFLVDAGFAVLLPNPRGSVGRGQAFARANLGDAGGEELADVVSGIDACAEVAGVDVTRVGVIGGSYGGYLAACAAAMTDRFACAVVMSGHPDLLSARYGSNNPAFYDKLMLGHPAAGHAAEFVERSPIIHVSRRTAPTLLLHGAQDRCSPIGQAEEMYRALLDCGVDTQLVVYPGEGHGLHSIAAYSDSWTRAASWLARYLAADTG